MNFNSVATRPAVLTSWKDIAQYMGKGVRTVQRWEQDFGLPIRRPLGFDKKAILARPADLDAWVALRCTSRSFSPAPAPPDRRPGDGSFPRASLGALSALNAQIQTARMLQATNLELMNGMHSALHRLQHQLKAFEGSR
ncbi:MAG TPA: hypothetical protein VHX13_05635 [Acidobacteriaceae bacterium]|jgi:hypothetical protein|nr:hypothetical protein [Acidobacteriaceae bacterium]